MEDLEKLCEKVVAITRDTARLIQEERARFDRPEISVKGKNDYVTHVDLLSEKTLVSALTPLVDNATFLAEEGSVEESEADYRWIIDPIDGTTNFIHGLSPYAISIALEHKGETILGVVHEITMNESFYAWKDGGAWLNGTPISVSGATSLADSLITTGFPYNTFDLLPKFMRGLEFLLPKCQGLRRPGSAATDLAYVACGRFELFYEYSLKPWDVAAGAFLVQMAGGKVTDFSKGADYIFGGEIAAATVSVHDEFMDIMGPYLN